MSTLTPQIALTIAAIVAGVLLDRLILSNRATISGDNVNVAPVAQELAPITATATSISDSVPVVNEAKGRNCDTRSEPSMAFLPSTIRGSARVISRLMSMRSSRVNTPMP